MRSDAANACQNAILCVPSALEGAPAHGLLGRGVLVQHLANVVPGHENVPYLVPRGYDAKASRL